MTQPPPDPPPPPVPSMLPPTWAATATMSRLPPPLASALEPSAQETVAWMRGEVDATTHKSRLARLYGELGDFEERAGDEPGAARDYLAAFNADPGFREPLEGLVRLLERRRSYRNLGKVIDALVKASSKKPDEWARALLLKAAFAMDVAGDLPVARDAAMQAARAVTTGPESALAWLTLELLAGKMGDEELRRHALGKRVEHTNDPTWRGLLMLDVAHAIAAAGDVRGALTLLGKARDLQAGATFRATIAEARLLRREPGEPGSEEASERARAYAAVLEAQAELVRQAMAAADRGDALGVPTWARSLAHMIDAWLRAADARASLGDLAGAARILDDASATTRALDASTGSATDARVARTLSRARMRVAERMGDEAGAARLAKEMLASEADPRVASALALRVAEQAASQGDTASAQQILAEALSRDPAGIATRAAALDLALRMATGATLVQALVDYAERLGSPEARARVLLVAAVLAGGEGGDVARAASLLATAAAASPGAGVPAVQGVTARLGRLIASVRGDSVLRESATRDLLASGADEHEQPDLWFEVIRSAFARGAATDAEVSLQALAETSQGAWLAGALEAFLPGRTAEQASALDTLAALEDEHEGASISLLAALRALHEGDSEGARRRLRKLLEAAPDNVLVVTLLADIERQLGSHVHAAEAATRGAQSTDDADLSAALYLEAGLERWRAADRKGAIESFELAARAAPEAARPLLRWGARGVDVDTIEGRRGAIERAGQAGEDAEVLALERFAVELQGGDLIDAESALTKLEDSTDGAMRVAADLARVVAPPGSFSPESASVALHRLAALGDVSATAAAAEEFRVALANDGGLADTTRAAARTWFDVGRGTAAGLEWLAASLGTSEQVQATRAIAGLFEEEEREALLADAAVIAARRHAGFQIDPVAGSSEAVRLANLELAPPGFDLERRSRALAAADTPLGADGVAVELSGWSLLAAGKTTDAAAAFRRALGHHPDDVAAWCGAYAAAKVAGEKTPLIEAARALAERSKDPERAARLWEEAGLALLDLWREDEAEVALAAAFDRDPTRAVAFDRLFRRVRDRKDGDRLLDLISRRLEVCDDSAEIVKLYWERARVLREKGDVDGAMVSLENVTIVDPDHVGALALTGEIFIRRGQFAEAADTLGRLARNENAPARNRATAGIAAVDLYETKLNQPERALEILVVLHDASLTNLAVRERLARTAAKAGAWEKAASILEELMLERTTPAGRVEAAKLAMAIRRDRLDDRPKAVKAMTKLLEESPADGDAIDLLLDAPMNEEDRGRFLRAARAGLLADAEREPTRAQAVRRLARVARALRDGPLEQAGLAAAAVLGTADDADRAALARLSHGNHTIPSVALTPALRQVLVAKGDDGPLAELFVLLGPTLAEALGPTLGVLTVGRRDRIDPRAGSPVRQEVLAWAGAFGIADFELYVGGRDPGGVQGVPGEPNSLVVGLEVRSPFNATTRARVARELFAMSRGTTLLRLRDEATVLAIVVAACKLAKVPIDAPTYAVQVEVDRLLSKAISRRTGKLLPDVCRRIAQGKLDVREWTHRAILTLDHIAAVATGDVGVVLSETHGQPPDRLANVVSGDRRSEDLLRFALSPGYLDVRRVLGLEGTP